MMVRGYTDEGLWYADMLEILRITIWSTHVDEEGALIDEPRWSMELADSYDHCIEVSHAIQQYEGLGKDAATQQRNEHPDISTD